MEKRGALYIYWGDDLNQELENSISSLKKVNFPYYAAKLPEGSNLGDKSRMYELSPFEETVYLDTDTILLGDLDFAFKNAKLNGLAISIAPACLAKRNDPRIDKDLIEYNTGVVFFSRNNKVEHLFDKWIEFAGLYPTNDQASFALAIESTKFNPFVLPQNWNLRAHLQKNNLFGPIKIWHSRNDLPKNINEWNNLKQYCFGDILDCNGFSLIKNINYYHKKNIFVKLVRLITSAISSAKKTRL